MPTLAAPVREGVSRSQISFVSFVVKAVSRRGAKGRYQNGCRYQRRYQISADSKVVRGKGSEVATSDAVGGFDKYQWPIANGWFSLERSSIIHSLLRIKLNLRPMTNL